MRVKQVFDKKSDKQFQTTLVKSNLYQILHRFYYCKIRDGFIKNGNSFNAI